MRLLTSLALLFVGIGLWLFVIVTDASTNTRALSVYQSHLQSFPVQETYSRVELAEAVWKVWTNKVSLPTQSTYTAADIKSALVSPLLGRRQDSCDRQLFEQAIGTVAGYRPDKKMTLILMAGILMTLGGAFMIGGVIFPSRRKALT